MKYRDDFDDISKNRTYTGALFASIAVISIVLLLVIYLNSSYLRHLFAPKDVSQTSIEEIAEDNNEDADKYVSTGLRVSDLDFYEMYKIENAEETDEVINDSSETDETVAVDDGKHTLVKLLDGTQEWIPISPNISKHEYDFSNLYNQSGKLKYFSEDRCVSSFGVDISSDNDYVDFVKLKKAGCQFVMIRVGMRGYQSGQLVTDDYFHNNLKRATDAGLDVGVYFVSEAVTSEEAVEEALYLIAGLGEYKIKYPVSYVMQYVSNDHSRIDNLTKDEKTNVARAFLNTVKEAGLNASVYGSKEWLLKEIDLSKIASDYDVWYDDTTVEVPDFPYKFTMWKYNSKGNIDGISGPVNFNICFIDYGLK